MLNETLESDRAYRKDVHSAYQRGYEQGKKDAQQRWIPVTERLPEDDTVVLVCGRSGGVYTAIHNNSKTWIRGWWKMNSKNHHCNPTAWMPLPKPWEGEENV